MTTVTINIGAVITVVLGLLSGGAGWWFGKSDSRKITKRVGYFFTDWQGTAEREGVAAVPGVMGRLASHDRLLADMGAVMAKVMAELSANGGGSVKDQTRANTLAVRELAVAMSEVRGAVGGI